MTSSTLKYNWTITTTSNTSEILADGGSEYLGPAGTSVDRRDFQLYFGSYSRSLNKTTTEDFVLTAEFGIVDACNEDGMLSPDYSVNVTKQIFFSFDPENGEEPDILAGGSCSQPVGSIGIEKEVQVHNSTNVFWDPRWNCLVLEKEPQTPQECVLELDESLAKSEARGLWWATDECETLAWKDVSYVRGLCDPNSSSSGRFSGMSFVLFLSVFVAGIVLLGI